MPPLVLTEVEVRIVGCLVEKSFTTPDLYPLTVNSLTSACNQKSSREPVMNLEESEVARALATLQEKGLVGRRNEPGSRVTKFMHHAEVLLNGGTSKEIGALCVLFLRGPQTPGEIKNRSERLCEFTGVPEVEQVLQDLMGRTDGPFIARLPRQTGQKEARYMHLFSGHPPEATTKVEPRAETSVVRSESGDRIQELEQRVKKLEEKVEGLLEKLKKLVA